MTIQEKFLIRAFFFLTLLFKYRHFDIGDPPMHSLSQMTEQISAQFKFKTRIIANQDHRKKNPTSLSITLAHKRINISHMKLTDKRVSRVDSTLINKMREKSLARREPFPRECSGRGIYIHNDDLLGLTATLVPTNRDERLRPANVTF